ncbi:MAG: peptidase [Gammaproteobacteria bacterium]
MTYCLAIKISEGLVFCSDSRTNAGADRVSSFSKMHKIAASGDRFVVLLSAGNLGTTQAVIEALERETKTNRESVILTSIHLSEIADYVGQLSVQTQKKYSPGGQEAGFNAEASFILGGQIHNEDPELYLIYPEGNHIKPSREHPFFQIGETKYGKPILDRMIDESTPHEIAMRCALVSMDSTLRSNVTVGPPIELMFLEKDVINGPRKYKRFDENDPYLVKLRTAWNEEILKAFNNLPELSPEFE